MNAIEERLKALGLSLPPPIIHHLILEVFGPETGAHARSAVGLAELPFDMPVEIEGEVFLTER
jgi:hypothetical protein